MAWHLAILLGVIAGAMVLKEASEAGWLLPACTFRQVTGVPCPGCGSTRALTALANVDLLSALRLNPMATATAIGLGILWCARFLELAGQPRLLRGMQRIGLGLPKLLLLVTMVAGNWLYLWLRSPR